MTKDKLENLIHLPLAEAYLCQDCHSIGNCSVSCPACGSGAVAMMEPWLSERKPVQTAMVLYERWDADDPVLDCAIFICDAMDYRAMRQ